MTLDKARLYDEVNLFQVHVQVLNVHELMRLETKLNKVGRVTLKIEVPGADEKYRPTIRSALFLVAVKQGDIQRFKAMLKLLDREMRSRLSYLPL